MRLLFVIGVLAAAHIYDIRAQNGDIGIGTGPPDPKLVGLDQKPLVEQLLARKAYMADYLKGGAFRSHKEKLLQNFAQVGNARGVLIVAGGRDMFANAAITVLMLRRHLHSSIPVEIVHFGAREKPQEVMAILQSLNGTSYQSGSAENNAAHNWTPGPLYVTDAYEAAPPDELGWHHKEMTEIKSFPAKVYAVAFVTRFQQVMLLDADAMPLVDPALLFGLPSFRSSGNLFWPDLWHSAWVNASIYKVMAGEHMDKPPWEGKPHHRLVDSGQLLLDRLRHADVMQYLWLLNSHHEWVYKHMHGDKDTFLLAFAMAGKKNEFKMVPCFTRDAMVDVTGHQHRYHHLGMVQSVPPGVFAATVAKASRAGSKAALLLLQLNSTSAGSRSNPTAGGHAALLPSATASNAAKHLGQEPFLRVGVPVVFHRTSFNSKFFPDCLDKQKTESKYCQVQYVSVPMSNEQAGHSLKPHMYAFNEDQVSTDFYAKQCNSTTVAGNHRHTLFQHIPQPAGLQAPAAKAAVFRLGSSFHSGSRVLLGLPSGRYAIEARTKEHAKAAPPGEQNQQQPPIQPGAFSSGVRGIWGTYGRSDAWQATAGFHQEQQQQRVQRRTALLLRFSQWLLSDWASTSTESVPGALHAPTAATAAGVVAAAEGRHGRQLAADLNGNLKGVKLQQLVLQQVGAPPEWQCDSLRIGDKELPIPFMQVELFRHMHRVLQHSYQTFQEVRELLKL